MGETKKMSCVALVTNMPAPYRIPIFQELNKIYGIDKFKVIYCTPQESAI